MVKRINQPLAIKRFMESHPLARAFVLDALTRYAVETLDAPEWGGTPIINQDAWRETAQAALDMLGE